MSLRPERARGHAGCFISDIGASRMWMTSHPGCCLRSPIGHTAPIGRRRPAASFSRRFTTSAAVTP